MHFQTVKPTTREANINNASTGFLASVLKWRKTSSLYPIPRLVFQRHAVPSSEQAAVPSDRLLMLKVERRYAHSACVQDKPQAECRLLILPTKNMIAEEIFVPQNGVHTLPPENQIWPQYRSKANVCRKRCQTNFVKSKQRTNEESLPWICAKTDHQLAKQLIREYSSHAQKPEGERNSCR